MSGDDKGSVDKALPERLQAGLTQLSLELPAQQCEQLVRYVRLLHKWNAVYNLTAVRDPLRMVSRHVLDSLVLKSLLHGHSLLDIGSGAGLPGLPLAITTPDLHCTLIDSVGKKTRFLRHVVTELELKNVTVVHARIENVTLPECDMLVSRAFSSPLDIIRSAGRLCRDNGLILFMLGRADTELDHLPDDFALKRLDSVQVPFESGQRHIAVCQRMPREGERGFC